jgi:hypothetical protein
MASQERGLTEAFNEYASVGVLRWSTDVALPVPLSWGRPVGPVAGGRPGRVAVRQRKNEGRYGRHASPAQSRVP